MDNIWIEAISVRSSTMVIKKAATMLKEEVCRLKESTEVREVSLMQHGQYNGDLAISIIWGYTLSPQKTREGFLLAERLRSLGTVDHAVWLPITV